jgi:hypothetical protein
MTGYHWCDRCEEGANGADCHKCHRPARFIETALPRSKRIEKSKPDLKPAMVDATPKPVTQVAAKLSHTRVYSPEERQRKGAELFAMMREAWLSADTL